MQASDRASNSVFKKETGKQKGNGIKHWEGPQIPQQYVK